MRILFVCQGNTCRSPMAEGMVRRFGAGTVRAESAGLRPGASLAPFARQVMEEVGIDLGDHRPQPLEAVGEPIDLVISLCEVIAPGQDLFPNASRACWRIPDPIGGPVEEYRSTRDRIWERLGPLLARLTESPDLPETLD